MSKRSPTVFNVLRRKSLEQYIGKRCVLVPANDNDLIPDSRANIYVECMDGIVTYVDNNSFTVDSRVGPDQIISSSIDLRAVIPFDAISSIVPRHMVKPTVAEWDVIVGVNAKSLDKFVQEE